MGAVAVGAGAVPAQGAARASSRDPQGRHTSWGGLKPFVDRNLFTAWPKPARAFVLRPDEAGLMELSEENRRGAAPNIGAG